MISIAFSVGVSKIDSARDVVESGAVDISAVPGEVASVSDWFDSATTWAGSGISSWSLKKLGREATYKVASRAG